MEVPQTDLLKIDQAYRLQLQHLEKITNNHVLILFSGPINAGKSRLARILEAELQAVRIENDAIRALIHKVRPGLSADEVDIYKNAYLQHLLPGLAKSATNRLWIIDASVDRSFGTVAQFAAKHSFQIITIAFVLSPAEHSRRSAASGKSYADIEMHIQQTIQDQKQFLRTHKPDIQIGDEYDARRDVLVPLRQLLTQ